MERFRRLTFLKRLTLKENVKLICNRQKFHLWVYHRYKTCRNAQTLKVSINALSVKHFQMRLLFKNSTSNPIFDGNSRTAEKIMKLNWWNQSAVTNNNFSFFDSVKNIFALFQHSAYNHPIKKYSLINVIFKCFMLFNFDSNLSEKGNFKWRI